MEFNNGNEHRKLNKKWERLRVQYQQAGMSEDAIQAMYDFDFRHLGPSSVPTLQTHWQSLTMVMTAREGNLLTLSSMKRQLL